MTTETAGGQRQRIVRAGQHHSVGKDERGGAVVPSIPYNAVLA